METIKNKHIEELSKLPKILLATLVQISKEIDDLYQLFEKHLEAEHGK